jgi:hypothetical protein
MCEAEKNGKVCDCTRGICGTYVNLVDFVQNEQGPLDVKPRSQNPTNVSNKHSSEQPAVGWQKDAAAGFRAVEALELTLEGSVSLLRDSGQIADHQFPRVRCRNRNTKLRTHLLLYLFICLFIYLFIHPFIH